MLNHDDYHPYRSSSLFRYQESRLRGTTSMSELRRHKHLDPASETPDVCDSIQRPTDIRDPLRWIGETWGREGKHFTGTTLRSIPRTFHSTTSFPGSWHESIVSTTGVGPPGRTHPPLCSLHILVGKTFRIFVEVRLIFLWSFLC